LVISQTTYGWLERQTGMKGALMLDGRSEVTALVKRTPFNDIERLRTDAPEWICRHRANLGVRPDDPTMDYWVYSFFAYTEDGLLIRRLCGESVETPPRSGRSVPFAVIEA